MDSAEKLRKRQKKKEKKEQYESAIAKVEEFILSECENSIDFPLLDEEQRRSVHEYAINRDLVPKYKRIRNGEHLLVVHRKLGDNLIPRLILTEKVLNALESVPSLQPQIPTALLTSDIKSYPHENFATVPPAPNQRPNRDAFPITKYREEILQKLHNNRIIVICGETGSGKSTQVPQFIMEDASQCAQPCRIFMTQPRRIAATSVAERISEERGQQHGKSVGHQIRMNSCREKWTNLIVTTSGFLFQRMCGENDDWHKNVTHIILDEVHEREIYTDLLMAQIKRSLHCNAQFKLIVMSATLDAEMFSAYFDNCPILHIPGRTCDVDIFHLDQVLLKTDFKTKPMEIYLKQSQIDADNEPMNLQSAYQATRDRNMSIDFTLAAHCIEHLHTKAALDESILVFLPGYTEIMELADLIEASPTFKNKQNFKLFILHSNVEEEDVFQQMPFGIRKIILSTNIAETSITINDVVHVIDAGKVKEIIYDPGTGSSCLSTVTASQACAKQRSGRAGRVRKGYSYRLYTKQAYETMQRYPPCEMIRVSLHDVCLKAKLLAGQSSITDFMSQTIQPPSNESIRDSIELLIKFGALDSNEHLTHLGRNLLHFPVDCQLGKMILHSIVLKCLDPVATIASALSVRNIFTIRRKNDEQCEQVNITQRMAGVFSDHQRLLRLFEFWNSTNPNGQLQFCRDNGISHKAMKEIDGLRGLIIRHLQNQYNIGNSESDVRKLNINSNKWPIVKACLVAGTYPNICRVENEKFRTLKSSKKKVILSQSTILSTSSTFSYTEWLIFSAQRRIGSPIDSKLVLENLTMIPTVDLLLLAGANINVTQCNASADKILQVDQFIQFVLNTDDADLVLGLRRAYEAIFQKFLKNEQHSNDDENLVDTLKLIILQTDDVELRIKEKALSRI